MAKKKSSPSVSFETYLVLFRYFLGEIGTTELKSLGNKLNSIEYEGLDENGNTHFHHYIAQIAKMKHCSITTDKLREYDERICRYTKEIGENRGGISLKYFQYISLLFTEMYLDNYFADRSAFCKSLNEFIDSENARTLGALAMEPYTISSMNKLAYMCATGSGKTLLMHINIKQFIFYLKRAKRINGGIAINKIIVLSPNEGMSKQHLNELTLSGIKATIFNKDGGGMSSGQNEGIAIIDMNKLKEEGKVKTVSVDSFERNNLVLVDEAHRGMSSTDGVWYDYRTRLSEEGFAFEYSATFKQALNATSSKKEDRQMVAEYGKSIIMDYSYKYFYGDGYGKDYRIYNLRAGIDDNHRHLYLIGCLLSFFQQVKYSIEKRTELIPFNIENPLLVFVGNRVTASTSKDELSDVQEVLCFIDRFVRNKQESIRCIEQVKSEETGLADKYGRDLFSHDFNALIDVYGQLPSAQVLYEDMLHLIFNTDTVADAPRLHIEAIKQVQGEIAMKIGEYGDYFGVINIGDTANLIKACEAKGIVSRSEEFVSTSLFSSINDKESKVRILIGSRKFTEGWNSWRVSTMGLINFAKGEGSQAIQLFGRGVRLKGYKGMLKRSTCLDDTSVKPLRYMNCVETLTIFGVKAQYMEDFKKFLEQEGAPTNDDIIEVTLPVVNRYDEVKTKKLRVIKVKDGKNFKKQARRMVLDVPKEDFMRYLVRNKSVLDCRSKIQSIESSGSLKMNIQMIDTRFTIPASTLALLDYYRIFDEIQQYKNEKSYFNISIDRNKLKPILEFINKGNIEGLSKGEKKLINANTIIHILSAPNSLCLFDEPDSHIHIARKDELKELINTENRYSIVTTHSPVFVNCLCDENIRYLKDGKIEDLERSKKLSLLSGGGISIFEGSLILGTKKILVVEGPYDKKYLEKAISIFAKRNSKYKALKQIAIIPAGSAGNAKTMYDDVLSKQVDGLELIAFLFDYDKGGLEGWKNIGNIKSEKVIPIFYQDNYAKEYETSIKNIADKDSYMVEDLFSPESYKEKVEYIHKKNTHKEFRCNDQGKTTEAIKKHIENHYSQFKDEWFDGFKPVLDQLISIFKL